MNEIKLLPWQEKVVYGKEKSLAVPAPTRSGKNFAIAEAARQTPNTLIVEVSVGNAKLTKRELIHKQILAEVTISSDYETLMYEIYGKNIRQIIFNETYNLSLLDLLQLREAYKGRIVVIGTPTAIPDPIFYPLSKIPEWTFVTGTREMINSYLTSDILNNLPMKLLSKTIFAQWC